MASEKETERFVIDKDSMHNLNITRRWTLFLSLLGFIFVGILVVFGILTGTFLTVFSQGNENTNFQEIIVLVEYLALAITYFFSVFFLYRFSKNTSLAVSTLNQKYFNKSLRYLKLYFASLGILSIMLLTAYFLTLILTGTSIAFLGGLG